MSGERSIEQVAGQRDDREPAPGAGGDGRQAAASQRQQVGGSESAPLTEQPEVCRRHSGADRQPPATGAHRSQRAVQRGDLPDRNQPRSSLCH
jgi:hypothetical protein